MNTIGSICPHCETLWQLQPDLVGKPLRCPNSDCQEIFVVQVVQTSSVVPDSPPTQEILPTIESVEAPVPESTDTVIPTLEKETAKSVSDYVPILDAEVVAQKPTSGEPILIVEAEVIPSAKPIPKAGPIRSAQPFAPVIASAPKVLEWNQLPEAQQPLNPSWGNTEDPDDHVPIITRKRRSPWPKVIFGVMVLGLFVALGVSGYLYWQRQQETELLLRTDAEKLYTDGKYSEAAKKYQQLRDEFPESDESAKYEFFAKLSTTQATISSVTTRENPDPAIRILSEFLAEYRDATLAKPTTGYGAEVLQAGQKLGQAISGHAGDQVKAFVKDRQNMALLKKAEDSIAQGKVLLSSLERFRDQQSPSLASLADQYAAVLADVDRERVRLAALAPWRRLIDQPTDAQIDQFYQAMLQAGLAKDAEVLAMIQSANQRLRELIRYEDQQNLAESLPTERQQFLVSAVSIPQGKKPPVLNNSPVDTVFGVARGVFYVLDASTGKYLWGTPMASILAGAKSTQLPLRIQQTETGGDWVVVPYWSGSQAGITLRRTRTGDVQWFQPLAQPMLGAAYLVGRLIYVPLQDDFGTVCVFNWLTGERLGQFQIRQPIGGTISYFPTSRPGEGYLLVPGDARRVYVFAVGRENSEGRNLSPQCVQTITTDHPKDSLRGGFYPIDAENRQQLPRLVYAQVDGPTNMRLKSFDWVAPPATPDNVPSEYDLKSAKVTEVPVSGWSWFPPSSNGERMAVATDSASFAVFGIKQPGDQDAALFAMPGYSAKIDSDQVSRSQVITLSEDSYWVLLNQRLHRFQMVLDTKSGQKLEVQQVTEPIGEPICSPQLRLDLGLGVVLVQQPASEIVMAVAFDLETGEIRWKTQLGIASVSEVISHTSVSLVVDQRGAIYQVDDSNTSAPTLQTLTPPFSQTLSQPVSWVSDNQGTLWVLGTGQNAEGWQLFVRKLAKNQLVIDSTVALPAALTGSPIPLANGCLLPLANGFLYHLNSTGEALTQGPIWRAQGQSGEATCQLHAFPDNQFFVTDGKNKILRWNWAGGDNPAVSRGSWQCREQVTQLISLNAEEKVWLIASEVNGGVSLFQTEQIGEPQRRWKLPAKADLAPILAIPQTKIVSQPGQFLVSLDREHLALLDVRQQQPIWEWQLDAEQADGEILNVEWTETGILLSLQSGKLLVLEAKSGVVVAETGSDLPQTMAAFGGRVYESNQIVQPCLNGTLRVVRVLPTGR